MKQYFSFLLRDYLTQTVCYCKLAYAVNSRLTEDDSASNKKVVIYLTIFNTFFCYSRFCCRIHKFLIVKYVVKKICFCLHWRIGCTKKKKKSKKSDQRRPRELNLKHYITTWLQLQLQLRVFSCFRFYYKGIKTST